MTTGLWKGTYASVNRWEYWAEGTNTWFNPTNPEGSFIGFGDTREDLKQYDPPLATLLTEVYGDSNWLYTPVATRTHQPPSSRVRSAAVANISMAPGRQRSCFSTN